MATPVDFEDSRGALEPCFARRGIPFVIPSLILACASQAPAPIAKSYHRGLSVYVIDAATNMPKSDALVTLIAERVAVKEWGGPRPVNDVVAWEEALVRLGVTARTDAAGVANFEMQSGPFVVTASAKDLWAEAACTLPDIPLLELRLEADVSLDVHVTAGSGATIAGVPVGLVARRELEAERTSDTSASWLAILDSDANGLARFPHAQRWLHQRPGMRLRAELAFPTLYLMGVDIDATRAAKRKNVAIVLPPCGSVDVVAAGGSHGHARLRCVRPDGRFWHEDDPLRAEIIDGRAHFPFVEAGLTLECDAKLDAGPQPVRMEIAGPARAEEHLDLQLMELPPTLAGRLLDDQLVPIGNCKFNFLVSRFTANSGGGGVPVAVTTDSEGRFLFELDNAPPASNEQRILRIRLWDDDETSQPLRGVSVEYEVTRMYAAGEHDCGDIVLARPGSDALLRRMDDRALEAEYAAIVSKQQSPWGNHEREYETCLTEIARRGGDRWIVFLQGERKREGPGFRGPPRDFQLLTALRRAEGKPDPLAIRIDTPAAVVATFPCLPKVRVVLKNVDAAEIVNLHVGGGHDGSGRFERCRIEAFDSKGARVAPWPSTPFNGGGLSGWFDFFPGEEVVLGVNPTLLRAHGRALGNTETRLDLNQFIFLPGPGEYRMRVQYHNEEDIAGEADVRGLILATSQPFVVRLEPLRVRLSSREVAQMKASIAAIDVEQPVLLTSEHWSPTMTFDGEPTSAADRLFRAGWTALPVLLDALADENLASNRRAWIVGLLWDIAGIFNPESDRENMMIPGNVRFIRSWKTPEEYWGPGPWRASDGYPDEWIAQLLRFSDRWRALRSCVQLEVVD